ncbi:hypothetical protein N7493_010999 [Penicillium malachiteum]|uniref:F-box domain-containing protein n=1 Tax=Penicillium malachiteum TaxID=1324776 RepID=A0AAD6HBB0_9EURO|nr:hypothetical protein N7493_010999 [Penicillium malachiteum]
MFVSFQLLPAEILLDIARYVSSPELRKMKDSSLTVCSASHAVAILAFYEEIQLTSARFQRLASTNTIESMKQVTKRLDYQVRQQWVTSGDTGHQQNAMCIGPELLYTTVARCDRLRSFTVELIGNISNPAWQTPLSERYDLRLIGALWYRNLKELNISTIETIGFEQPLPCTVALSQLIAQVDTVTLKMKYICPQILEYICPDEFDPHLADAFLLTPENVPTAMKHTTKPADVKLKKLTIHLAAMDDYAAPFIHETPHFSRRCGNNSDLQLFQPMLDAAAAIVQRVPSIEHLWVIGCFNPGQQAKPEAWDLAKRVRRVFSAGSWYNCSYDVTSDNFSVFDSDIDDVFQKDNGVT